MLLLLACAGNSIYAINSAHVLEVVPRVRFRRIPHSPDYLLGHINFSGVPIPIVDLSLLVTGQPSNNLMHTRIILLQHQNDNKVILGLVAEKVTELAELDLKDFFEPGISSKDLPYLDGIYNSPQLETIQLINIENLFKFLQKDSMARE